MAPALFIVRLSISEPLDQVDGKAPEPPMVKLLEASINKDPDVIVQGPLSVKSSHSTVPFESVKVPLMVKVVGKLAVVDALFIVRLFKAVKSLKSSMAPLPPIVKLVEEFAVKFPPASL